MMRDEFPKRITKWAEVQALKDAGRLTQAEVKLIDGAQEGEPCIIGTSVPTTKSDAVLIRAPLIRYLALGGCEDCEVEAAGVQVVGAWIDGVIDLRYASAKGRLALVLCHIADRMELLQCTLPGLNLTGNTLPSALNAQGAQFAGDVVLNEVTTDGEVRLSGATIGGQLSCEGAKLNNPNGDALNAQGAQITEDVFVREATACGEVRLSGATIGGQLACEGATFRKAAGKALNLQRAIVKDGLYWREIKAVTGLVDLNSLHAADIVDDASSWEKCDETLLIDMTYDTISPSLTIRNRLDWLRKGTTFGGLFHPQPYEQLAKVLRESGHRADAREIMVEKERRQLAHRRDSAYAQEATPSRSHPFGNFYRDCKLWARRIWHGIFGVVAGYGHKPYQAIIALGVLIALTSALAFATWRAGDFAPNNGPILISADWISYADSAENPAEAWSDTSPSGRDYETFNAVAYGADIVIPLISFGQEAAWAPSTTRSWWGWHLLWIEWIMTLFGWIITAIGAAAVTTAIRQD